MSLITSIAASAPDMADSGGEVIRAGILDWTKGKANELENVLQVVATTVAILFVVYKAVQSKFAIGTIIVSALAAGVFVWIVYNVVDLKDSVGNEMPNQKGAPAVELRDVSTDGLV